MFTLTKEHFHQEGGNHFLKKTFSNLHLKYFEEFLLVVGTSNTLNHTNFSNIYEFQTKSSSSPSHLNEPRFEVSFLFPSSEQGSLLDLQAKENKLTPDLLCLLTSNLLSFLLYLRQNKISHNNIQPQNIIFHGKSFKLIDMRTINSLKNGCIETPEVYDWISPELYSFVRGEDKDLKASAIDDSKSDVYSLGLCLLFACGFGKSSIDKLREVIIIWIKQFL